jgi:uncharacterized membrane protein YeaQ/YmgE (transglycosylase-associated protein family)
MTLELFAMWVLVGLMAGWLAGFVMKSGGYGLRGDLILGLVGSLVGSWLFWALEVSPSAGLVVSVVVAFLGASIAIVAQRKLWYGYA